MLQKLELSQIEKLHINQCEIGQETLDVIKTIFQDNTDLHDF